MRLSEIKPHQLDRLNPLKEEALESRDAEDVWSENGGEANEYRSSITYQVRKIKDSSPLQYEVFAVSGMDRKPYGKFSSEKLAKVLQPIRPNQTPDVEGYMTYVNGDKVEAFQYKSDPIKILLNKTNGARLNKGDYLIRTVRGDDFEYSVETEANFDAEMKKV